jgi:hypothetical protein
MSHLARPVDTLVDEEMSVTGPLAPTSAAPSRNVINGTPHAHHDRTEPRHTTITTPNSQHSHSTNSDTLVSFGHPLRYSPPHLEPEGFSPYNDSFGSSQPLSSPCLRLTPYIHLDSPPQDQTSHSVFSWQPLPRTIPIDKRLKAVLSLPSSSFNSSPSSSGVAAVENGTASLHRVPEVRPDQLGFSEYGFIPLPLTAPPPALYELSQSRKQAAKRDAKALIAQISGLFDTMDSEARAKFVADLTRAMQGLGRYGERFTDGYTKGREEARAE